MDRKPFEKPRFRCVSCGKSGLYQEQIRYGPPLRGWSIRCSKCWEKEAGKGVAMQPQPKRLSHIERQAALHERLHPFVESFDNERTYWEVDARQAAWDEHLRKSALPPAGPWDTEEGGYSYQQYLRARYPGKYEATKDEKA